MTKNLVVMRLLSMLVSQHAARASDVQVVCQKILREKITSEEVIREISDIKIYQGKENVLNDICNKIRRLEEKKDEL